MGSWGGGTTQGTQITQGSWGGGTTQGTQTTQGNKTAKGTKGGFGKAADGNWQPYIGQLEIERIKMPVRKYI